MLRQKPDVPLPLHQHIIHNRNDDIRVLFLCNKGHDPRDLIVLESGRKDRQHLDETQEPPNGGYAFFDRDIHDQW